MSLNTERAPVNIGKHSIVIYQTVIVLYVTYQMIWFIDYIHGVLNKYYCIISSVSKCEYRSGYIVDSRQAAKPGSFVNIIALVSVAFLASTCS